MNRRIGKATTALLLVFILIVQTVQPSLAYIGDTIGSSRAQNQSIYEQLQGFDAGNAEQAEELLRSLGLLDENGELNVSQKVNLDGVYYSLDELTALLSAPDTDLSRIGYVDGTPVALGDLKLMLEIEAELARIRDTYFSGDSFSEESLPYLNSLLSQIDSSGISLFGAGGTVKQDVAKLRFNNTGINLDMSGSEITGECSGSTVGFDFVMNLSDTLPAGKTGSFKWRLIDGSIPAENVLVTFHDENGLRQEITNTDPLAVKKDFNVSLFVYVRDIPDIYWKGTRTCYIEFYDAKNIIFPNNKDCITIPIYATYSEKEFSTRYNTNSFSNYEGKGYPFATNLVSWRFVELRSSQLGYSQAAHDHWITLIDTQYSLYKDMPLAKYEIAAELDASNASVRWTSTSGMIPDKIFSGNDVAYASVHSISLDAPFEIPFQMGYMSEDSQHDFINEISFYSELGKLMNNDPYQFTAVYENAATPPTHVSAWVQPWVMYEGAWIKYDDFKDSYFRAEVYNNNEVSASNINITLLNDDIKPTVETVKIPAGDYYPGQIVPITVTYSRPVNATTAKITVNRSVLTGSSGETINAVRHSSLSNQYSKVHVFEYVVKTVDGSTVHLTDIFGAADVFGNVMDSDNGAGIGGWSEGANDQSKSVSLHSLFMVDAVQSITLGTDEVSNTSILAEESNIGVELAVSQLTNYKELYMNYRTGTKVAPFAIKLTNVTNPGNQPAERIIPLYLDETDQSALSVTGTITGLPLAATGDEIYLVEIIAYANEDDSTGQLVYGIFGELTVKYEAVPTLAIPDSAKTIIADQSHAAQVRWFANRALFSNPKEKITVEVFEGKVIDFDNATLIHTGYATVSVSSYIIPENVLDTLGDPAYTVRVSVKDPVANDGSEVFDTAYIVVVPPRIRVKIDKPSSVYMLDTATLNLSWSIDNYESGTTAEYKIDRISTASGTDTTQTVVEPTSSVEIGSYTLNPADVTGLKDTYIVTVRARNDVSSTWNTDSLVLYVYNEDALELGSDISMSNLSKVDGSNGALPTTTEYIMKLREQLGLIEFISINYSQYDWSQLKDIIQWASSDSSTVSVNYKRGTLYENLSDFPDMVFLPDTDMALSGLKDGTAVVTATHANTGMSDSVTVDVESLRDRLYIFQMYPNIKTTLTYTNGDNQKRTVDTNDKGTIVLYEPSGIKSDILLKAESNGDVYLGTLYNATLLSGERDPTKLALYPQNNAHMRLVAKAEIFLKKPDGTPFTGNVTLRGGVFKNGEYCQDASMGSVYSSLKDGKVAQTVTVGTDGRLTVYMDSTQFWSAALGESGGSVDLTATDNLRYIFEITGIQNVAYKPLLLYIDGSMSPKQIVSSAESVVTLETSTGMKPFAAVQVMDYSLKNDRLLNVRNTTGEVGPNETYKSTKLVTTMFLWGQPLGATGYHLDITDEFGYIPASQTSEQFAYPFSSIPLVRNTITLSTDTVTKSGWVAPNTAKGIRMRLSHDGTVVSDASAGFKVCDMNTFPRMKDDSDVKGILLQLNAGSAIPSVTKGLLPPDGFINGAMRFMSNIDGGVGGSNFKMIVTPTDSLTVFKALIWAGSDGIGLDEADYDGDGFSFEDKYLETGSTTNMMDVASSFRDIQDPATFKDVNKGSQMASQLEGYYEAEIRYNFDKGEWELYTTGGGFTAGFSIGYSWTLNAMAGPVPVTASLDIGGTVQLDFKTALRYSEIAGLEWASTVNASKVNDYLTTLRINAYIKAFAGVGFDFSVVALKIGVFGQLSVDNQNKFLSRTYLEDTSKRQISGQGVEISGSAGIEFTAKFLFISFSCVIASVEGGYSWGSGDYKTINDYWSSTGSGLRKTAGQSLMSMAADYGGQHSLEVVSYSATLESRDYLVEYARSWGEPNRGFSTLSLDDTNKLSSLQTNAYPESRPVVSDDGELLLYNSDKSDPDITQTRVFATGLSGGSYPEGNEIDSPAGFDGYGDSSLRLSGTQSFAAAAWVRMGGTLPDKYAGDIVTADEQALLMSTSEIVASVYNGSTWVSTRITDNQTPDLAPVVATNGSKAIVAWRSVYAGSGEDIINFDVLDQISYKIYSGGVWGDTKTLYNGTTGAVKGLEAAMLPDGTAAVAYTLDRENAGLSSDFETAFSIVLASGEPGMSVIITSDDYLDENPQIAAVDFGSSDYRFVLGWHSVQGTVSDIRLAAIDKDGMLSNSFIESIRRLGAGVKISGNFRLASSGALTGLSILWTELSTEIEDSDVLRAVKFADDESISAVLDVAEMPERTKIDHFSAYAVSENEVRAVIQSSEYREITLDDSSTYTLVNGSVYVPKSETKLYTATAEYENKAEVLSAVPDYVNLAPNNLIMIQFTISNEGYEKITAVDIKVGNESPVNFTGLMFAPNDIQSFVCYYLVGATVENVNYTVTSHFEETSDVTLSGTVYMDYPDVGISTMEVVGEDRGIRTVRLTLFNYTDIALAKTGRSVIVDFYDDSLLENPVMPEVIIDDIDELRLIDEGAYAFEVSFDVGAYITQKGKNEIPASGIPFYASARIEQDAKKMPELYRDNNTKMVLCESLLTRTGEPVSIFTEQSLLDGKTVAEVTLRNNSLQSKTSGNVVASLLDSAGNILETQQTYGNSTVSMDGEESKTVVFTFSQSGSRIIVSYASLDASNDSNARLSSLSFEGLPIRLSDFTETSAGQFTCSVETKTIGSTVVSFAAENPGSTVKVNGKACTGASDTISLTGETVITIEVTSKDGAVKTVYKLIVKGGSTNPNPNPVPGGNGSMTININGITLSVTVDSGGIVTIKPTKDEIGKIIEALINGDIAFDTGKLTDQTGVTGIIVELDPAWLTNAKVTLLSLSIANMGCVKLSADILAKLSKLGKVLQFKLTMGSLVFDILAEGKSIGWYDYEDPILVIMPTADTNYVMKGIPRSWVKNNTLYGLSYTTGRYEAITAAPLSFTDTAGKWMNPAAQYMSARGGISGIGNNLFAPERNVTRAEFVTMLMRALSIEPQGDWKNTAQQFTDVPEGVFYYEALQKAKALGIVNGVGDNKFNPTATVTRQDMFVMLYNAMEKCGLIIPVTDAEEPKWFEDFIDADNISSYSKKAMSTFIKERIVGGKGNGILDPKGTATRAEAAQIIYNMLLRDTK